MPATDRSEATRRLILETATRLFAIHGYDKTSTAVIAKEAGLSQGSIFHYFATKDALFSAIVRTTIEHFRDCAVQASQGETTAPAKLRLLMRLMGEQAIINQTMSDLLLQHLFSMQLNQDTFETFGFQEVLGMINETFEEGKRQGVFRDIDTQTATFSLVGLYIANYLGWMAFGQAYDFVHALQQAVDMLIDGISASGAGPGAARPQSTEP